VLAAAAAVLAFGCGEASESDPTDLKGVFEHSRTRAANSTARPIGAGGVVARKTQIAAKKKAAKKRRKKAKAPRPPTHLRTPIGGQCVAKFGTPMVPDRRPAKRPACRFSRVMELRDNRGLPRYGCVFAPRDMAARSPLPLVVFFHDDFETPVAVHRKTRLRRNNHRVDLTGDEKHRGYILLAPQARRFKRSPRWDVTYGGADHADARFVDQLIEQLLREGLVDPRQVYAIGAGRGGRMAALYAMLRPARVAAFATYASDASDLRWSCDAEPTPAAVVYRACDTVTPCADVEQWLSARDDERAPTLALRLGATSRLEPTCVLAKAKCRRKKGRAHHNRWPKRREKDILQYLGRYSLQVPVEPR